MSSLNTLFPTMQQQIILVRHGESQHQVMGLTGGWTDTPLTDRGRHQAECVGQALVRLAPEAGRQLFSSDLLRARETAEAISRHLKTRPLFRPELRELNNGVAKDKSIEEARALQLPVTRPVGDWLAYPGAESWRAMSARVTGLMDHITGQSDGGPIVIVSHGNALVPIVHWWLGLGEEYWSRVSFDFDCASITRLTVNAWGEKTISKLNDTCHWAGI